MNVHWKTQISKLLILEVQHMMMNIIVLWYLHGITELQRSFWVSRHQNSWYFLSFLFSTALGSVCVGGRVDSLSDVQKSLCYFHENNWDISINILPEWEKCDTICKDISGGGYFWTSSSYEIIREQALLAKYIIALWFYSDVGIYFCVITKLWCW